MIARVYKLICPFQLWLLGYEFPATLFVLTQDGVHIVTTKKKGANHFASIYVVHMLTWSLSVIS